MFKKVLILFDSGKLVNCVWFFGCVALGITAIAGMAWAYCGSNAKKGRRCESGASTGPCAAGNGTD